MSLTHWWRARALGQNAVRLEREMEEEMRFHMEMEAAYLVARGEAPAVARRRARIAFGGDERFKEDAREGRALRWLSDFRSDMVFALRSLRRSPAFTTVAVVALGIGIGANATVFALVDSVAFKQLPIKEPERSSPFMPHTATCRSSMSPTLCLKRYGPKSRASVTSPRSRSNP